MVVHFLATVNNAAYEHLCTKFCVDLYVIFSLQWDLKVLPNSIVPPTTNLHALKHVNFIHRRIIVGAVSVLFHFLRSLFHFLAHGYSQHPANVSLLKSCI